MPDLQLMEGTFEMLQIPIMISQDVVMKMDELFEGADGLSIENQW